MLCPRCHEYLDEAYRHCPHCGADLARSGRSGSREGPTVGLDQARTVGVAAASPGTGATEPPRGERYLPGTVLAGRYRVIGLLGRGGMGEVYRADDLRLGQPVALKFLPLEQHDERDRMAQLEEVRTARRVAHPNVCRVYDIGEADGHSFLSMEYVDGEDLATLLRRIGRLPRVKATELARQICAGLAAAHEQGILHRDLKPANIMVDGRGRARITDFGLAHEAEVVEGDEARAGTPAYMAPEQLAGREASARSDIYALGLVLYELFTGRPPFEARTFADALAERSSGLPSSPASHVEGLDPAVERAILRCLEPDPEQRPRSALQVAAALPGGDPLAAAVAAGETPSPELVAAAPAEVGLRPAWAGAGVVFCLVAVLFGQWFQYRFLVTPDGRPPVVLADRAEQILNALGHPTDDHDSSWGYGRPATPSARPMFDAAEAEQMATGAAPPYFTFWYRSAPGALMPEARAAVSPNDPPRRRPGSALVRLTTGGDLVGLEVWPDTPATDAAPSGNEPDWDGLFDFMGLTRDELSPVPAERTPPMFATAVAAWEGSYASGLTRRVEAAARDGRIVWLRVFSPEVGDQGLVLEALPQLFLALLYLLFLIALAGGLWLARSNLRSGRGDRRGAWRVAAVVGATWLLALLLRADHAPVVAEFLLVYRLLAGALLIAVLTGIFYLGIEPFLRRHWPHRIVGWSRALAGRFTDPVVGRDLFVAGIVAVALQVDAYAFQLGQVLRGSHRVWSVLVPDGTGWSIANILAGWPFSVSLGIVQGLGFAVLLLLAARTGRHEILGGVLIALLMVFGLTMRDQTSDPALVLGLLVQSGLMVWLFLRYGLLAVVAGTVCANLVLMYPTVRFTGSWLANGSTVQALTIPLIAAYGAWFATRASRTGTAGGGGPES